MTTTLPETIRAEIHPDAMTRVAAFFDATPAQALNEVLQNARRSGASRIEITTADDGSLTVTDNGEGIADPRALLGFGTSGWTGAATQREHPAGMGTYALARLQPRIRSRAAGGLGWEVNLETPHFEGQESAAVKRCNAAPEPHGTEVRFTARYCCDGHRYTGHRGELGYTARGAARHLPIPVTIDGEDAGQQPFLDKARAIREWNGLRLGVIDGREVSRTINFHGAVATCRMPDIRTIEWGWTVLVDVIDNGDLELVLPGREKVIETPFLQRLREEALDLLYATLAEQNRSDRPVAVPHEVAAAAAAAGHDVKPAPATLQPILVGDTAWSQRTPRHGYRVALEHERGTPLVMVGGANRAMCANVARAIAGNKLDLVLYAADPTQRGYGWYDRLTQVERVRIYYKNAEGEREFDPRLDPANATGKSVVADDLVVVLEGRRSGDRRHVELRLPTDLAAGSMPSGWEHHHSPCLIVKRNAGITAADVARFAAEALFVVDEGDDRSPHADQIHAFKQRVAFQDRKLRESTESAQRHAILQALEEETSHHCPMDRDVEITIVDQVPEVRLGEAAVR